MATDIESYSALTDSCALVPASDVSLLRLSGKDHIEWLQGQITNDVYKLEVGGFLDTCFCTATGHIEAIARIWGFEDFTLLGTTGSEMSAVQERIERFVVMEDVESVPLELNLIRLQGPQAIEASVSLEAVFKLPSFHTPMGGLDLWFGQDGFHKVQDDTCGLPCVSPELLDAVQIEAGIPAAGSDWNSKTLAAELGPRFNARTVSLDKGCYVGQEVLMRIASRGHTNREWVPLILSAPSHAGARVSAEGRDDAGVVTRAAQSPRMGPIATAMLRVEASSVGTRVLVDGLEARVAEFPL